MDRRQFLALSAALTAGAPRLVSGATLEQVRLGVTTDEISDDVATAAKFLHENGLSWAEVRVIWGKYNTEQPLDKIKEARGIFDANGIKTSILGTAFFRGVLPKEDAAGQATLDKDWKLLDAAFDRAEIMGTRRLRTFGFLLRPGDATDTAARRSPWPASMN